MPGLHHHNKRKRIYEKHEPYPHPNRLKRLVDRLVYLVGAIGIIMTVPQIASIWIGQNAAGVSAVSWATYTFIALFWVVYGVLHKEKPIILIFLSWVFLDILIVAGVLLYG